MRNPKELDINPLAYLAEDRLPYTVAKPPYSDELLASTEYQCQLRFPDCYKQILKYCNGGKLKVNTFCRAGSNVPSSISMLFWLTDNEEDVYGIADNTLYLRAVIIEGEEKGFYPDLPVPIASMLAFAVDGGANFLFMDAGTAPYPVYFCYFDMGAKIVPVHASFEGFIDSLLPWD